MPATVTTAANVDSSVSEFWQAKALQQRTAKAVVSKSDVLLYKTVEGMKGDVVRWTELSGVVSNDAGTDGGVAGGAVTHTARTVTLDNWREVSASFSDRAIAQSVLDQFKEFTDYAARLLAQRMDDTVLDDHGSLTTNVEGSTSVPSPLNEDLLNAGIADLDGLDIPAEDRTFIFHTKNKSDLLKLSQFTLAYATGLKQGAQLTGEIPPLYGVKSVVTTRVVSTGSPAVRKNLLLHKECIGFALQKNIRILRFSKTALNDQFAADALWGEAVLRENHGAVINAQA